MKQKKILFIDRDGTLIVEPEDKQVDSVAKLVLMKNVIAALLQLQQAGFIFVMISNQDGLGSKSFPQAHFDAPHQLMLAIFASQSIQFDAIHICPHVAADHCYCRKPNIGLLQTYLIAQEIDRDYSYVIGDRETDLELAKNIGIAGIKIGETPYPDWQSIANAILKQSRTASMTRKTNETDISIAIDLNTATTIAINTGIAFFDHMLEQLAKHGGFSLTVNVNGDLDVDDHHTVEDTAIVLGSVLKKALGNKIGINRYGFLLPMDESLAQVALDLSGRFHYTFAANFTREKVGELSTELVPHFFRSLAESLQATLHIDVKGENNHHMIEAIFKAMGRTLKQAIQQTDKSLPSTKGLL